MHGKAVSICFQSPWLLVRTDTLPGRAAMYGTGRLPLLLLHSKQKPRATNLVLVRKAPIADDRDIFTRKRTTERSKRRKGKEQNNGKHDTLQSIERGCFAS